MRQRLGSAAMGVAAWVLVIVLAAGFAFGGITKLLDLDRARDRLGYSKRRYQLIGTAELDAAIGIVVGLMWSSLEFIAIAAGIGICALMVGALMAHARAGDETKLILPAVAMFVLSVLFMVFISLR